MFIAALISSVSYAWGACPGATMPALTASQNAVMLRSKSLGHVPTDSDISSAANVQRIKRLMTEAQFNYLFPRANADAGPGNGPYSYANFIKAAAMWPGFCNESGNASDNLDTICAREMASMFAMWAQEVGGHDPSSSIPQWRQALYWFEEMGCSANPSACGYCSASTDYPCVSGQSYFGRGAYQLSYNFNYGPFSYAMFGDASVLLNNPGLLVQTGTQYGWLSFASAIWFHMTPQSPKPSMHDIVANFWTPNAADIAGGRVKGFGAMTMVINGGVECGGTNEGIQSANRISYYTSFAGYFNIDPLPNTGCAKMQQFDAAGSAAMPQYWEQSWTTTCACQLVTYQTAFSIFDNAANSALAYQRCLNKYYSGQTTAAPTSSVVTSSGATSSGSTASTCAASTCSTCSAIPGNSQAATDAMCAPCAKGAQPWWPCNVSGLCQCTASSGTTAAPATTGSGATTKATTTAVTTAAPTTGVTTTTPTTKKPTTAAPTTKTVSSTKSSTTKVCGTTCLTSCIAIPGNYQAATDAMCSVCKGPTPYAWWPCNQADLCQCV